MAKRRYKWTRFTGSLKGRGRLRDIHNRLRYGAGAPRYAELIWVDPSSIKTALVLPAPVARYGSGRVVRQFPDASVAPRVPVQDIDKIAACLEHFSGGVSWHQTRFIRSHAVELADRMGWSRSVAVDFLVNRFSCYDDLYEQIKTEGQMRTRQELRRRNFREEGGVVVHLGPDGELFYGKCGNRRFAIALALGLQTIPAIPGYVHVDSLSRLAELRVRSLKTSAESRYEA